MRVGHIIVVLPAASGGAAPTGLVTGHVFKIKNIFSPSEVFLGEARVEDPKERRKQTVRGEIEAVETWRKPHMYFGASMQPPSELPRLYNAPFSVRLGGHSFLPATSFRLVLGSAITSRVRRGHRGQCFPYGYPYATIPFS